MEPKSKGMQCLLLSLGLASVESAAPVDKNEQFACFSTMSVMMMRVSDHMGLPNLTHA